jgi:hypothetical protein
MFSVPLETLQAEYPEQDKIAEQIRTVGYVL